MCQRPSVVSTVGHILLLVQVSVNCLQNAKSTVCEKICHVPWSRCKTECVAVKSRPVVMLSFKSCPIYRAKGANVIMWCNVMSGSQWIGPACP
jgi:hypothetical protein